MSVAVAASSWGAAGSTEIAHNGPEIRLETVCCPGCSGDEFAAVLTGRDHLTGLGGEFSLVRCVACDLHLTNPRPAADSLGYFYPSNYSPYTPGDSHESGSWLRLLERSALRCYYGYPPQPPSLLTRVLAQLAMWKIRGRRKRHEWFPYRGSGNLLDVGCGGGGFLERMRDVGWNVTGLELAADVARCVEKRTGIPVHVGTLPHADLKPGSFDAVTLWHVLEHVPNPRELLKSAADLLRPSGLLVIEVPNIANWTVSEFGEYWVGLELPRHFQHFSPKTLAAMLPEGAFRNIEIQQIGSRSLMKLSVQPAFAAGETKHADWLKRGKVFWTAQADRTETANRADLIRLVAERI